MGVGLHVVWRLASQVYPPGTTQHAPHPTNYKIKVRGQTEEVPEFKICQKCPDFRGNLQILGRLLGALFFLERPDLSDKGVSL
jgi:hypothetical protein